MLLKRRVSSLKDIFVWTRMAGLRRLQVICVIKNDLYGIRHGLLPHLLHHVLLGDLLLAD